MAATAHRAQREEGGRMGRIAWADLVLPPGLPCLAGAEASSDLASRPAPGLVKAWCLLPTREVLSRPWASACASGETQGHRWWLRHLETPKSPSGPSWSKHRARRLRSVNAGVPPWLRGSGEERSVLGSIPQPPGDRADHLRAVTAEHRPALASGGEQVSALHQRTLLLRGWARGPRSVQSVTGRDS